MPAMTERRYLDANDVRAAMRRHYCGPEWAILFEVADATGARHSRFADAIAMSLWPSRGLSLHGFEIKVYRHDWLREKANPEKAERIACRCDYWWVVAPPGIIETPEVPENWGQIIVETGGDLLKDGDIAKLRIVKQAIRIDAVPIDRTFMAALFRSLGRTDGGEVQRHVDMQLKELRANDERRIEIEVNRRSAVESAAAKHLGAIVAAIGEDRLEWLNDAEVAQAVAIVHKTGIAKSYDGLESLRKDLLALAGRISDAMDERGIPKKEPEKQRRRL